MFIKLMIVIGYVLIQMKKQLLIAWYLKETGVSREDLYEEIIECDIDKNGMWIDFEDKAEIEKLELKNEAEVTLLDSDGKRDFGSLLKHYCQWFIWLPFRDVINQHYRNTKEPFVIASTEW